MPNVKGFVEETQDELAIEFDTVTVADGDTFTTHISNPSIVLLQIATASDHIAGVADITGNTVTVNLVDSAAAAVTVAEAVYYVALGTP